MDPLTTEPVTDKFTAIGKYLVTTFGVITVFVTGLYLITVRYPVV